MEGFHLYKGEVNVPARKRPNPIPQHDLSGNDKMAQSLRALHMRQFSPFGHKGGPILPPEEKRKWHQKGAQASVDSKKRRKTLSNLMKALLDQKAHPEMAKVCGLVDMFPDLEPEEITYGMLLTMSVLGRGVATGRADQYTVIRDTIGEKPRDNLQITGEDGSPINPPNVNVIFASDKIMEEME